MKHFFPSMKALALSALFMAGSHALLAASPIIRPVASSAPGTARPSHYVSPGFQAGLQELARHGHTLPQSVDVASGATPVRAHNRFQSMQRIPGLNGPAGQSTWMAQQFSRLGTQKLGAKNSTTPQATSGLPLNFPGFLQADALFPAAPADEQYYTFTSIEADVNKDGLPDLINVEIDGEVFVMLNPGGKNLASMHISSVNDSIVPDQPYAVYSQAQDLDGDGYPELTVFDYYHNTIDIFHNQKDGTFAPATRYAVNFANGNNFQGGGGGALFGDVNGDGILDMVVISLNYGDNSSGVPASEYEMLTYPGKGDGTFGAPMPEQNSIVDGYVGLTLGQWALADMNGDGKLDLVFSVGGFSSDYLENGGFVSVLPGTGTGTFTNLPTVFPPNKDVIQNAYGAGSPGGFSVQDVDGDGKLDVLLCNTQLSSIYLLTGNGDGTLNDATAAVSNISPANNLLAVATSANFADATGDGITDVIAYFDGFIAVYAGQGKGVFSQTPAFQITTGLGGDNHPLPADFDGDGIPDLARVDTFSNMMAIYLGSKTAIHSATPLAPPGENPNQINVVATGDFNGDGVPDVIAIDGSNGENQEDPDLILGLNDKTGKFTYTTLVGGNDLVTDNIQGIEPVTGDLNGDGKADILLTGNGSLWVILSTATGFAKPTQIPLPGAAICLLPFADIGDINGDGHADIVAAYGGDGSCFQGSATPSGIYTLLGKGDGTFTTTFTAGGSAYYEPKLVDFNNDGKLDLAISDANFDTGKFAFYVIPGAGDGTFKISSAVQPAPYSAVTSIMVGDYDGDGKQDLTLGLMTRVDSSSDMLPGTSGVEFLRGFGDFTFSQPELHALENYPVEGKYADFNGDGKLDLALSMVHFPYAAGSSVSNLGYMVNLGDGSFSPLQQTVAGADEDDGVYFGLEGYFFDYGFLFVGDFNQDGAIDVLTSDNTNDEVYISNLFLNQGAINLALTASATASAQDAPVTFTATLTPSVGSATPSGTMSFYDNGALLESEAVTGDVTTVTLTSLPVGSNAITATYSGDASFNGATAGTSVSVAVTALTPNFTLSAPTPGTLTLAQGATGTVSLALAGNATFSGAVQFTCTGAPTESTCTVVPGTVTLAPGGSSNVAIVVATTPKNGTYSAQNTGNAGWMAAAGGISMAGLALFFLPARRRRAFQAWMLVLVLAGGAFATFAITGCGSSSKYPGTTVGNATLTVTATAGSITQSQTIALTVTK